MSFKLTSWLLLITCGFGVVSITMSTSTRKPCPNFFGLGDLPGGRFQSRATAVSADGDVVVGVGESAAGREGFYWTPAGGMEGLGFAEAASVSADGAVVVGYRTRRGKIEPVRWTRGSGVETLSRDDADAGGAANAVSQNGANIVGSVDADQAHIAELDRACLWTT
jgi:probable HAF family extracellular repeat protein